MENMLKGQSSPTPQIGEPGEFKPTYRCPNQRLQKLSFMDRTLEQPCLELVRFVVSHPEPEDAYTVEAIEFWPGLGLSSSNQRRSFRSAISVG